MKNAGNIAIKVSALSKVYKKRTQEGATTDFYALKDVNLSVEKGQILGIIGKNGSGKSTLLKILSGITKPSSGSIEINGTVNSILDVGTGFHPDLSGRENVYLRGELLGMANSEIQQYFDKIVDFSGIGDFIDTPVKNYSSGMFLRLAFSVVIHLKADILLLDEVMSVGDVNFQEKCFDQIKKLARNKSATIILVSHDVASLSSIAKQLILIESGSFLSLASKEAVIDAYISKYSNQSSAEEFSISTLLGHKEKNFKNSDSILIKIAHLDYSNKNTFISLRFKDVFNNVVFISSPILKKGEKLDLDKQQKGYSLILPAYLFNKGVFYIDLIYSSDVEIVKTIYNIGHFIIELDEYLSQLKLYGESGALKPYLEWKDL